MNESTNLRKRILKMRENNDFILSSVTSEHFKEDVKKKIKSDEVIKENKEGFIDILRVKMKSNEASK